jgi:hypothetical protein
MSRAIAVLAVLLLAVGCSSADEATSTSPPSTTTSTTTTAAPTTTTTTTTVPPSTTTSSPTTTSTGAGGTPEFVLRLIVFGDLGFVSVQNVGTGSGGLGGYYLCQFPDYFALPDIDLAPSEQLAVASGDAAGLDLIGYTVVGAGGAIGDLTGDGEMALYLGDVFTDADAIRDYVEWGSAGHARSEIAIAAGIWPQNAFVAVPPESLLIGAITDRTVGPDDWTAEFGG